MVSDMYAGGVGTERLQMGDAVCAPDIRAPSSEPFIIEVLLFVFVLAVLLSWIGGVMWSGVKLFEKH